MARRSTRTPNPRRHRITCNLNDEELTRFKSNLTQAGHTSESAYLRDQALRANPNPARDKDRERAFLQDHVRLSGAIHEGRLDEAKELSKALIGRIVR